MTQPDLLDERLSSAFSTAHQSSRWATDVWPDPVTRIKTAARRDRLRRATGTTLALVVVLAGAGVGLHALALSRTDVLSAGASPTTGLGWLLAPQQYDAYTAAHPSPSPSRDLVTSPAPVNDDLRRLHSDLVAGLGPDAVGLSLVREDSADGGERGALIVGARLADGTPVVVERHRLTYPVLAGLENTGAGRESFTAPESWSDDTAYTVVTGPAFGYSFDGSTQWNGPFVWTVTSDGWFTSWTAPVSADRLLGWAQAGDASFTAG